MTTVLETFAEREPQADGTYRVYFRVVSTGSVSTVRAYDVQLESSQEQPFKLAELLAIKYILYCGVLICGFYSQLFFV